MPELPEVETVARSLRPRVVGRTIRAVETSGLDLRLPVDGKRLARACVGGRVEAIDRHGKFLLLRLTRGEVLVVHLGMSGRLVAMRQSERRAPHTHAVFDLGDGDELRYVDPRRFGLLVVHRAERLAAVPELAQLGPDPLEADFTLDYLEAQLASTRRDVKQFLLDQTRIAGLGNIYVCEALYRSRISPRRRSDGLGAARAGRLHGAIREVLSEAIERRGTTFRSYVDGQGEAGGNQLHLDVYGREGEPCHRCETAVARLVQGGRSTFYCARCQR